MKKLFALLLVCGLMFSFAGCKSEEEKAAEKMADAAQGIVNGTADAEDYEQAANEYASAIQGSDSRFSSASEYIDYFKNSAEMDQARQQVEAMGLGIDISARGNDVVYKYTYSVATDSNTAAILQETFSTNASSFQASANAIRAEAPCVDKVVFEYYSMYGEFLASASF